MKKTLREKIGKTVLIRDGAVGTMLLAAGMGAGETPESWLFSHPDEITALHEAYLAADADIITAVTFGANRVKCARAPFSAADAVKRGVALARGAVDRSGKDAFVGLDVGPTGKLLRPYGDLSFDEAYDAFAEQIEAGRDGSDIVMIATMSDIYEARAALLAAKENCDLPVYVTLTFGEDGKLLTGADISAACAILCGLGADLVGMNCGLGPDAMLALLPKFMAESEAPVAVMPNAGLPVVENGKTRYPVGAEEFADYTGKFVSLGAAMVGGCCGTTPEHIRAMVDKCKNMEVAPREIKKRALVASYTHAVELGGRPLIIGERINPTGKKAVKRALRENDMDFLCREALAQTDAGAHILDVNVGLPELDEKRTMEEAVTAIQSVCDAPLQIDTSDARAMERALRIYNGRALINSVNGKDESMRAVFPLAKKYGAAVVALTLDENGIPDTAEGRIAIAKKILARALEYGLDKTSLVFDALAMTVSTGGDNADIALRTIDHVKNVMGCRTVLGVSNISFGLPCRDRLNAAFFTLALGRGLSAGIINPMSGAMMDAYRAYLALSGNDAGCAGYIAAYSESPDSAPANAMEKSSMTLFDAVRRGLSSDAARLAAEALESDEPMTVVGRDVIPALDEVGAGFEKGSLFLPQLLMSADAARAAFDVIKSRMNSGDGGGNRGRIVLATVKGDVHDIGKNILKVLLENYGFSVVDLGKDVSAEVIRDAVKRESARLVGLSALMTTTVANMESAIALLRRDCPGCLVMVGGAVLNAEYSKRIGADFYSKDAMGAVRFAESVFGDK
jgi:5-methyltetrahydrofolate--homocysteine methyltransferase